MMRVRTTGAQKGVQHKCQDCTQNEKEEEETLLNLDSNAAAATAIQL